MMRDPGEPLWKGILRDAVESFADTREGEIVRRVGAHLARPGREGRELEGADVAAALHELADCIAEDDGGDPYDEEDG